MASPMNRQITQLGSVGIVLAASIIFLAGCQMFRTQQAEATTIKPLAERLTMAYNADTEAFEVSGWTTPELRQLRADADLAQWLQVHIVLSDHEVLPDYDMLPDDDETADLPAIIGDYQVNSAAATVSFQPRYGWSSGQSYVATLDLGRIRNVTHDINSADAEGLTVSFFVPAAETPAELPEITQIYPSGDEVPENLLRFYIEFSQPIQRGNVYDVVHLFDATGDEVEWPFLRIGQEFWDRDMQVLTIILDPGRIKEGVAPNLQAGAPLTSEGSYQLVIGADMTDAYGRSLEQTVTKTFKVVAPDHQSPDPTRWELSSPVAGTQETLTVHLDGAIDSTLAPRLIRVEDENGQPVATTFSFDDSEQILRLTPTEAWSSGRYHLAVHPMLEDYAGNRVESLFDMAPGTVADLEATALEREPTTIEFQVRAVR